MTTVFDVPAKDLIDLAATKLKAEGKIEPPEWSEFVKTGIHREKAPVEEDWWYTRTAAVLRKVYTKGPIGVQRLRAEYGGPVDRGSKPEKARKGSGAIIRTVLQQLEEHNLVAKDKKDGRIVTPAGRKFMDNIAHEVWQKLSKDDPAMGKY